jgi:ABC-type spermidine/putrescine transport system permease subunit II
MQSRRFARDPQKFEESATASGATWGQVARIIIVPLMMPALFAGWI